MDRLILKKILMSKVTLAFLVIFFGFLSFSFTNLLLKNQRMNKEIQTMEQKNDTLSQASFKTKDLLEYLRGKSFNEKEARLKLNLVEPGEQVVVIVGGQPQGRAEAASAPKKSNLRKWLEYFFGSTQ